MKHTELEGFSVTPRECALCGSALTDIVKDDRGKLWSRCPHRATA